LTFASPVTEGFLAHFAELRQRGFQVGDGVRTEMRHGSVVTRDGPWTAVTWTGDITTIDPLIDELSRENTPWEWHWYSSDNQENLPNELLRHGFTQSPTEEVLFADTTLEVPLSSDLFEVTAIDSAHIDVAADLHAKIFGRGTESHTLELAASLDKVPPLAEIFIAYRDGVPVGTGRIEYYPDSPIAGLFGAGTLLDHRHQGVYRAILSARLRAAQRRGYRYSVVEAVPTTSAPILKSLGFRMACHKMEFQSPKNSF